MMGSIIVLVDTEVEDSLEGSFTDDVAFSFGSASLDLVIEADVLNGTAALGAPKNDVKEACCCFADEEVLGRFGDGGDDMIKSDGSIRLKLGCMWIPMTRRGQQQLTRGLPQRSTCTNPTLTIYQLGVINSKSGRSWRDLKNFTPRNNDVKSKNIDVSLNLTLTLSCQTPK